jgi:hypothetical protein
LSSSGQKALSIAVLPALILFGNMLDLQAVMVQALYAIQ